jgi:uncharacterized phage protein gp47/JayE
MAFARPTLSELVDRIGADLVSRLELDGAVLRRAVVRVLAVVIAGAVHLVYGFLDFLSRQLFPDTAEAEYLRRWGSLFGLQPHAPTFATGPITVTGANGTVIPANSKLTRSDGAEYETQALATIVAGTAAPTAKALVAGADGSCDLGTVLTFESPIAGADATAAVAAGWVDGTDEESDDEFRARILDFMRNPPQGGSEADYDEWAKEVAGVTRVWVIPAGMGPGSVVVYFARDDDADGPIPDAGEVTAVQTHLNGLKPATAAVTAAAPISDPLNLTLHISPDTPTLRTAVQAQVVDMLRKEAAPSVVLPLSKLRTAIGITPGLDDYNLTAPAADVPHATGHMATMGVITWA